MIETFFNLFGFQTFGSYELFGLVILIVVCLLLFMMNMPIAFILSGFSLVALALLFSGYGTLFSSLLVIVVMIIGIVVSITIWKTLVDR